MDDGHKTEVCEKKGNEEKELMEENKKKRLMGIEFGNGCSRGPRRSAAP